MNYLVLRFLARFAGLVMPHCIIICNYLEEEIVCSIMYLQLILLLWFLRKKIV